MTDKPGKKKPKKLSNVGTTKRKRSTGFEDRAGNFLRQQNWYLKQHGANRWGKN